MKAMQAAEGDTGAQQPSQGGKVFLHSRASRSSVRGGMTLAVHPLKCITTGVFAILITVAQQWANLTHFTHITKCSAMHAQGTDHVGGSRTTSPSPGSTAEPVAAGRGQASRSTSPAGPSVQIHSEVGDAISTKRRSPEPLAGVESCHGSSKVPSTSCGLQSTTAHGLQCLCCLSSLMGRGGCGRELTNLSGLPCQ